MPHCAVIDCSPTVSIPSHLLYYSSQLVDSLRLDLSSRPTVKQWTQKQKELTECESKLHDLIVMRRESAELMGDRKNMTVKQKVLMDKRNFELGLWVLDSLPNEVTKNSLKAVCRELGLTDIGDIQPSIIKLKTVVGAVPRMERFITEVRVRTLTCSISISISLLFSSFLIAILPPVGPSRSEGVV
jgi:hypothetical protein